MYKNSVRKQYDFCIKMKKLIMLKNASKKKILKFIFNYHKIL